MYVRALLNEGVQKDGVLVPQRGVTRDPKGDASAFLVGADGKVAQRTVHVGRTVGDQWLVEDGLLPGDRVIVEGLQKVQPGMPVRAVEAANSAAAPAAPVAAR
jgi:membrane fusion protein (multidrug efflux system)